VETIREELLDRFGRTPLEVDQLLEIIKVKILLTRLSIQKFEMTPSQYVLTFHESTHVSPQRIVQFIREGQGKSRLTPESKLIVQGWPGMTEDPLGGAKKLLQALS
jgi:transcription-repair coupling factor (superfamily II helicase)